jgi:hypothetical protein
VFVLLELTMSLDLIELTQHARPSCAWSLFASIVKKEYHSDSPYCLRGQLAVPAFTAIDLLPRPELIRYLASRVGDLNTLHRNHWVSDYQQYHELRLAAYPQYVEYVDYHPVFADQSSTESMVQHFIEFHTAALQGFNERLAIEQERVNRQIARLFQRTAPIHVQDRCRNGSDVGIVVNDQPITLSRYGKDTLDAVNVIERLPLGVVPDVKWRSDLCIRVQEIQVGTPFIDLRVVGNACLKGRATWINLSSWQKASTHERNAYPAARQAHSQLLC